MLVGSNDPGDESQLLLLRKGYMSISKLSEFNWSAEECRFTTFKTDGGLPRSEHPSKFSLRSDCEKLGKPTENKNKKQPLDCHELEHILSEKDWERKSLLS